LFCKIIAKEIPNYTVYEDKNILAFLDIHPCSKGHTVVVPKKHFSDLFEMSESEFIQIMDGLRHAMERVQEIIKPEAMNVGINNGKAAGQAVGHVHWHILPRWTGDGGGNIHSIIRNGAGINVEEIYKLFL